MVRISINGKYLELQPDLSVTFQKKNILFAFDEIECERSTSFDIPATRNNDALFAFAKDEHNTGAGMRTRYSAVMEVDSLPKFGYLYTTDYDAQKNVYMCVFVCGELLDLQAIKNAGILADLDLFRDDDYSSQITNSQVVNTNDFCTRPYYQQYEGAYAPAVRLQMLLEKAAAKLNVTVPSAAFGQSAVLLSGLKTPDGALTFTQTDGDRGWGYMFPDGGLNTLSTYSPYKQPLGSIANHTIIGSHMRSTEAGYYKDFAQMRQYTFVQNTSIRFPDDTPIDVFILSFPTDASASTTISFDNCVGNFLGDYSFTRAQDGQPVYIGTALNGRTIDIPAGTPFVLLRASWFVNRTVDGVGQMGWLLDGQNRDLQITVEVIARDAAAGDWVALHNNLPEVTLIDLMKIAAAYDGGALYYTSAGGLSVDMLNYATWNVRDISDKIISVQNIARTIMKGAQHNYVRFAEDDTQIASDIQTTDYAINNTNLLADAELYTIPFSSGGMRDISFAVTSRFILRNSSENVLPQKHTAVKMPIIGRTYLQLQQLTKGAGMQSVYDQSTQVKMQVLTRMYEFNAVQPKEIIYARGVRYIWTEAQWDKGVMTIFLQKIT